jgi:peptide deformylase
MTVRDIVLYAENKAALRKRSRPVKGVNQRVKRLVRDLKDTLNDHPEGIGLAAPQINIHRRVVVVRLGGGRDNGIKPGPPTALINPKIIEASDEENDFDGCLSFPGLYTETVRPHYLRVTGLDEQGKPFDRVLEGFDAVVVHHEIDHLDGVLFIDRVKHIEDLYRMQMDAGGNWVRVSVLANEQFAPIEQVLSQETPRGNRP